MNSHFLANKLNIQYQVLLMYWRRAGYEMASKTHLFLKRGITTFTVKKKITLETDTCFKENHNSKRGLFSTSGPILEN